MLEIDLNKMSLDEVLEYCHDREVWALQLLINCEGYEKTCSILADNGRI